MDNRVLGCMVSLGKRWGSDTRGVEKDSDARFAVIPRLGKNQLADKWKSHSRDEDCHQGLSMLDL